MRGVYRPPSVYQITYVRLRNSRVVELTIVDWEHTLRFSWAKQPGHGQEIQ